MTGQIFSLITSRAIALVTIPLTVFGVAAYPSSSQTLRQAIQPETQLSQQHKASSRLQLGGQNEKLLSYLPLIPLAQVPESGLPSSSNTNKDFPLNNIGLLLLFWITGPVLTLIVLRMVPHLASQLLAHQKTSKSTDHIDQNNGSHQVDRTNQAASVAQTASNSALTSNQDIEQSVQAIANLRTTIATTAKKVKRLGESSQHVAKVASLINEVAVRANFLAINASLEASRSESNRSFTNISEEVGELATRSAAATKEIEELINNIQADSGEAINCMELGTVQVVECTQLVESAKQNLNQMVAAAQQINQLLEPQK